MAGRPSNTTSPERVKQTAIDSFNSYQSFILTPQDLCWVALVVGILAHSDKYPAESVYKVLQILLREAQNDIIQGVDTTKNAMGDENEADMRSNLSQYVRMFCLRMEYTHARLDYEHERSSPTSSKHDRVTEVQYNGKPGHGIAVVSPSAIAGRLALTLIKHKKSFLGIRLRRCRLAYLKLSEAALQRLHRSFVRWLDGVPDGNDFSNDIVERREFAYLDPNYLLKERKAGYTLVRTSIDDSSHPITDAYERFEFEQHTGNISGAVENLRRYFDQRFHNGRQPPRQHALNALAHHHFATGDVEAARLVSPPIFYDDTDGRRARKAMEEREKVDSKLDIKVPGKYSVIQIGTSPLDMLFDVRLGVRKRFEATGCLDVSPSLPLAPLNTQWQIWAMDALLWRLSGKIYHNLITYSLNICPVGISKIADIGDKIVLSNTRKGEDIRLYSICTRARRLFQKAQYMAAFGLLLSCDTWSRMNMAQYSYWSCEIWHLMWDIATRRGQEKFKREYLASRKPSFSQADG
ncbi:11509_t:CDS:2, partial [Acaulospora colombiana]